MTTPLDFLNNVTGGSAGDVTEYRFFLFGLALVLMMLFRPQGLLPSRQRAAELAESTSTAAGDGRHDRRGGGGRARGGRRGPSTLEVPTDVDLSEEAVTQSRPRPQEKVLVLRDCTMEFGGVVAMSDVSIEVHKGQIFGIIGPNGAGKTTLFNCVTGVYRPTDGEIELDGAVDRRQEAAPHHRRPASPARSRTSACSRT